MKTTFLLLILIIACSPKPRAVSPLETYGMLNNDFAVLIDTNETIKEIADPAKWIPASKIATESLEYAADKMIILYGPKSRDLCSVLSKRKKKCGHFKSLELWKKAGLPTKVSLDN